MFKAIFGFLGLMIALAVVVPLAKPYLGALWQSGQTTTRVHGSKTAGVDKPAVAQPASGAQKSMFGRTDDSWRQSKDRYKSAEERSDN